ncbi:MAG: ABC transporter ATP-binding protein [Capsulimonadaceae bacterium]|nr:ABC transporter ATP-binding protein [Capsulimonadaceae bacterium]
MANNATQQPDQGDAGAAAGMTGAISSGTNDSFSGEYAIEIVNLVKRFRNLITREWVTAVNDISLEVKQGEIFGFLGPNGAGKTTTIKALLGLIFPDAGTVKVLGRAPGDNDVKYQISYLPESPYFYEHMSAKEVISFYASLFGMTGADREKRVDYLIDLVGLKSAGNKPLRAFSKGMLQRVGIAQSLVNDPKVLFFDEPTSGLDPIAHRDIRDLILHLKNEGRTLFLSSHQLSDVEEVCDRVSILYRGKIRKIGRVDDLIAGGKVEIIADNLKLDEKTTAAFKAKADEVEQIGSRVHITGGADNASKQAILDIIRAAKADIVSVTPTRRTLEDIFIETVRGGEEEAGEALHLDAAAGS